MFIKENMQRVSSKILLMCLAAVIYSKDSLAISPSTICTFSPPELMDITQNLSVIGTGASTVGEDVDLGTILYANEFSFPGQNLQYSCIDEDALVAEELPIHFVRKIYTITTPYGPAIGTHEGADVFPTNVPGVGVKFEMTAVVIGANTFPNIYEKDSQVSTDGGLIFVMRKPVRFSFKLIKMGKIDTSAGTQQVLASSFPSFQITYGVTTPIVDERIQSTITFSGQISLVTKTCQIATPVIEVTLGKFPISFFKAKGTVTEWKDFEVNLKNCPPFYGYNSASNQSGVLNEANTSNNVSLSFFSPNGSVESNPYLLKINGGIDSAQGIGIELSRADEDTGIIMDGTGGFDLADLTTVDNGTYTIPLKARYVQYDDYVKAGPANGSVIYTITYQ